jgi:hypothetical protein
VTVSPDPAQAGEQRRLASAASLVSIVASHVDDMAPLLGDELPAWLQALDLPTGWRIARMEGPGVPPARIALCGQQPSGGWDGCETVSVFRFSGIPPAEIVRQNADCTLRDLSAEGITTCILPGPLDAGVTAVRSSGTFALGGRRIWAQHSNYLQVSRSDPASLPGVLVEQSIFVDADCRERLVHDIEQLTDGVYESLLRSVGAAADTPMGSIGQVS